MSIKALGYDGTPFNFENHTVGDVTVIRDFVLLQFSGNYSTGGDALDLTNGGGTPASPTTVPPAASVGVIDLDVIARSSAAGGLVAGGGSYVIIAPNAHTPLQFADLANLKVKIFTSGNTELAAGAYPASVTGDVVILEIPYAR